MSTKPKSKSKYLLEDVLKKKGKNKKYSFWRKRLVQLTKTQLIIYKDETNKDVDETIDILPTTTVEFLDQEKPPKLIIHPEGGSPISLSSDSLDTIFKWVNEIRNITITTPGLSMSDFDIISVIGRGFYGKVMLVKKKNTEEFYAIKTVHKNLLVEQNKVHTIFAEKNVLMKSHHPFIVNLCFAFQTETKVYLGLEYASGGELFHHLSALGKLPVEEVRFYVAELALAIDYLHSINVIYRDIKPENVLLDSEGHVKLTDFGLAKILTDYSNLTETFCGTNEYLAPEVVSRRPYGPESDWWAVGVFTYELLFGKTPFAAENRLKIFKGILNDEPEFPGKHDKNTISFINMLLEKDPAKRGKFAQIKEHPFFNGMNFDDVLAKKYQPLYVPPAQEGMTNNFDQEFTKEKAFDSMATPLPTSQNNFNGFSYVRQDDSQDEEEEEEEVNQPELPDDPSAFTPSEM